MAGKMHMQHARNTVRGKLNLIFNLMRVDSVVAQTADGAGAVASPCPQGLLISQRLKVVV